VLGADHPDTLGSRNNLAYAYRSAGRLDQAIPLYERTLADSERVLGADHPQTLTSRNNLAYAYESASHRPLVSIQSTKRIPQADEQRSWSAILNRQP
jgi:tetratricopeptide (TPR) repeat protein